MKKMKKRFIVEIEYNEETTSGPPDYDIIHVDITKKEITNVLKSIWVDYCNANIKVCDFNVDLKYIMYKIDTFDDYSRDFKRAEELLEYMRKNLFLIL